MSLSVDPAVYCWVVLSTHLTTFNLR